MERAERAGKTFRYIRPTHEEIASFLACAHAKFTGEVGVWRTGVGHASTRLAPPPEELDRAGQS